MAAVTAPAPSSSVAVSAFGGSGATLNNILKLSNRLMAPFATHLEYQFKISLNEFRVLMLIGRLGSTASVDLAELTGVNKMSVSRAISALHRHGRVAITRDQTNCRRKTLILTTDGERFYRTMLSSSEVVVDYLLSNVKPHESLCLIVFLKC